MKSPDFAHCLYPQWDAPANIGALSTTRAGGVSHAPYDDGSGSGGFNLGSHVGDQIAAVEKNRIILQDRIQAQPVWLTQVHGNRVVDIANTLPGMEADACIATRPGLACTIMTADCLPVLFCDIAGKVVGAAHAGWRGLAGGVLENTVAQMRAAGAGEILAWLGPAIGPQRFEVGADVYAAFVHVQPQAHDAFTALAESPGKYLADIYLLAR